MTSAQLLDSDRLLKICFGRLWITSMKRHALIRAILHYGLARGVAGRLMV